MLIENSEQYNKIPDGTKLRIYLTGNDWYDPADPVCKKREVKCIKIGERLYPTVDNQFFHFSERNEGNFDKLDFIVCNFDEDNKDVY
jgi:hypothetical protein